MESGTGAGITGNTEFDKFIPEIWSSAVEGFLRRKLQFKDMITDYSSFLSSGGDRVHVPTLSEVGLAINKKTLLYSMTQQLSLMSYW